MRWEQEGWKAQCSWSGLSQLLTLLCTLAWESQPGEDKTLLLLVCCLATGLEKQLLCEIQRAMSCSRAQEHQLEPRPFQLNKNISSPHTRGRKASVQWGICEE